MARSVDAYLLQGWTAVGGSSSLLSIPQAANLWFDLAEHEDVSFTLEVREVTGTVSMNYETSPSFEDASFLACITPFSIATGVRVEPRKRQPLPAWLLAAAAGAIAGGGVVYSTGVSNVVSRPAPTVPTEADLAAATDLRREASTACDASNWAECLADLDRARALDLGGDDAATIKTMRDRAIRNIRGKP
jgi:hypothetical protein